jgi:hypothetical protein
MKLHTEDRMRVFGNKVLSRIFRGKKEERRIKRLTK